MHAGRRQPGRSGWRRTRALGLTIAAIAWSAPELAHATEVRVGARTIGEGYVVLTPGDSPRLLRRRRLVQYVNLGVYELLPPTEVDQWRRDPEDGQIEIVASMRLRHDFGEFLGDAGPTSGPVLESVDGRQIDLLYGYVQGREIGGFFDFRAGRQFETSGLDWYAFDGGWARVRTPAHLAVEAFGGMQVNAANLFGWPTFQLDGTSGEEGADRAGSPVLGAGLSLVDVRWMDARVAYRRTFTPASINRSIIEPTGDADGSVQPLASGVDQELVSATMHMRLFDGVFAPFGALRFNLGTTRVDDISAGATVAIGDSHHIRAQYLRTIPSFDLDSIFNLFSVQPFEDVRLSYQVRPGGGWRLEGRGGVRLFRDALPERRLALGWTAALAAAWQQRRFTVRTDSFVQGGEGGTRAGGSVDSQIRVAADRIGVDLRSYFTHYQDDLVVDRRGWGLAFQAGADFQLWQGVHLTVLAEEMVTPYLRHALRLLGMLSADWSFRVGRRGS